MQHLFCNDSQALLRNARLAVSRRPCFDSEHLWSRLMVGPFCPSRQRPRKQRELATRTGNLKWLCHRYAKSSSQIDHCGRIWSCRHERCGGRHTPHATGSDPVLDPCHVGPVVCLGQPTWPQAACLQCFGTNQELAPTFDRTRVRRHRVAITAPTAATCTTNDQSWRAVREFRVGRAKELWLWPTNQPCRVLCAAETARQASCTQPARRSTDTASRNETAGLHSILYSNTRPQAAGE